MPYSTPSKRQILDHQISVAGDAQADISVTNRDVAECHGGNTSRAIVTGCVVPGPSIYGEKIFIVCSTVVCNAECKPSIWLRVPPRFMSLRKPIFGNAHSGGKVCNQCVTNRDPTRHPLALGQILAFPNHVRLLPGRFDSC